MTALLRVSGLKKHFPARGDRKRKVYALDGVGFSLRAGETLGIVGESGCGKSTLGRTVLRLLSPTAGQIFFDGQDLLALSAAELRKQRRRMQIIFQDPFASLDPRFTVSRIVAEPLRIHGIGRRKGHNQQVIELLQTVGLPPESASRYPHEFSGGQRQRIAIARALALRPSLIIADEPVSALDVSIQSQILNLLVELKREFGLSYLFISHDLAVVEHISDRVAVMYLGKIVELADADDLFSRPGHPYTRVLIESIPQPDPDLPQKRTLLSGELPNPETPPPGCPFHTRCPQVMNICRQEMPKTVDIGSADAPHQVCCHLVAG